MSISRKIYAPRKNWSVTDTEWLKYNYNLLPIESCMEHLGREAHSIYNKAGRLGIDGNYVLTEKDEVRRRRRLKEMTAKLCEDAFQIAQKVRSEQPPPNH